MKRRSVLQAISALPILWSARLYAAAHAGQTRLLVVFMRGGYDAASLLIPYTSDFYYEARPTIAISRAEIDAHDALRLDGDWALHPALKGSLLPFYQRGELAFIPFAGTRDLSRSHFETQHVIEVGAEKSGDSSLARQSGFLNRLSAALKADAASPIAFTQTTPAIFRGTASVPNIRLTDGGRSSLSEGQADAIARMYAESDLADELAQGLELSGQARQALEKELREANGGAAPASRFEAQVRRIARLMSTRYNLGFVDVGGWDTHVGQGNAKGALATRLGELGRALAAYAQEMGAEWKRSTVVVISEFGRTFRENGSRGTDHGHGTVYWVMGGGIRGGQIVGEQAKVSPADLHQERDYPVLNEYREVFAGMFGRMYGLDGKRLSEVFPGIRPLDVGLV